MVKRDLDIQQIQSLFLYKCLGQASPPYFVYNFSKKKLFLMLHSINWPNFIVFNPFSTEKIEKIDFSDAHNSTTFKHQ